MNWKKQNAKVSNVQFKEAREFEAAGLTTISQAVRAFAEGDTAKIKEWRQRMTDQAEQVH